MTTTTLPKVITRSAVSTIWYDRLSTALTYQRPLTIQALTTLNEKLGINQAVTLPANSYPSVKYYSIGDKGHLMTPINDPSTGNMVDVDIDTIQHAPNHGTNYNMKPFVVRATTNDLSATERAKYALRKTITVGGVSYYAYYLKRLDLSAATDTTVIYTESNGIETVTDYVPDASTLNPQQIIPSSAYANTLLGTYIKNTIQYTIEFDSNDIAEYYNACQLLGDVSTSPKISELAICQGLDYNTNVQSNGSSVSFTEAICVQVAHYAPIFETVKFSTLGFNVNLIAGMDRALFTTEQVAAIV